MKYLLLLSILAVVWWLWSKSQKKEGDSSPQQPKASEKMVECSHCGVHLPESESVMAGDRVFCSEAHRLAARDSQH